MPFAVLAEGIRVATPRDCAADSARGDRMFALPIIARELRVRARKPWTVWTRVLVGLLISLLATENVGLNPPSGWGGGAWRPGTAVFDVLTVPLFLLCLTEGVGQTAACSSKHNRD